MEQADSVKWAQVEKILQKAEKTELIDLIRELYGHSVGDRMYSESLLAVKYRVVDANGQMSGGPMYYIRTGLGQRKYSRALASAFAFFGVNVALFGIGIFPQVNAIVDSARIAFNIPETLSAFVISLLVAFVTLGGIRRIAAVAQLLVPFMNLQASSG